jgi:PST family polysaccharide transporter
MFQKLTEKVNQISPELRKIISNIGWLFTDRLLRMGVGILVTAWLARYLGTEQFGLYNFAIAFVTLFHTVATLGLDQIVVRNIVSDIEHKNTMLGTALTLRLSSGILLFLSANLAIFFLRPDDPLTRWVVGIIAGGLIFEAFNTIDLWFQSQVQSKYTVLAKNIGFILITTVRIILISIEAPLVSFAWAALAETGIFAISLTVAYHVSGQKLFDWKFDLDRGKTLLQESWPLILSGLAIMVYLKIDQVMLGQLADDAAVGIYSGATRISEVWYFVAIAIVNSVNPSILESRKVSESKFYKKLQKLFNLMAVLAYAIAIPVTFLSRWIVVVIFGAEYAAAGLVLSIHIWAALFVFFGWSKGIWIIAESQTLYSLVSTSAGAVLNIILNFWLIPQYREVGAAIATVVSYGFTDYVLCFIYPPARRLALIMTESITLTFVVKRLFRRA